MIRSTVRRDTIIARIYCDECGSEIEYTWMHVGRHSYHVGRCARCAPPPTIE